jgi:hypothetical protein
VGSSAEQIYEVNTVGQGNSRCEQPTNTTATTTMNTAGAIAIALAIPPICNHIDIVANANSVSARQINEINTVCQANSVCEQQRDTTATTTMNTAGAIAVAAVIPPLSPFPEVNNVGLANQGCQQNICTTPTMTAVANAVPIPFNPPQPTLPRSPDNGEKIPSCNVIVPTSRHLHNELTIRDDRINALENAVRQLTTQLNSLQEKMILQSRTAVSEMARPTELEMAFELGCTGMLDDDQRSWDPSLNSKLSNDMEYFTRDAPPAARVNNNSPRPDEGINEERPRATVNDSSSPQSPYFRNNSTPSQRNNARCTANDNRNAGLVNNDIVCYANAVLQIIASCVRLNKALSNSPDATHEHFSLYYKFACVISSMVRMEDDQVVDPRIFMGVFSE